MRNHVEITGTVVHHNNYPNFVKTDGIFELVFHINVPHFPGKRHNYTDNYLACEMEFNTEAQAQETLHSLNDGRSVEIIGSLKPKQTQCLALIHVEVINFPSVA